MMVFVDSSCDGEHSKKQELWKTASLDRNPQLNQPHIVKRYARMLLCTFVYFRVVPNCCMFVLNVCKVVVFAFLSFFLFHIVETL